MIDIKSWIGRAVAFMDRVRGFDGLVRVESRVDPSLNSAQLLEIEKCLRVAVPKPIRWFLVKGAAGCLCRFSWHVPAGLRKPLHDAGLMTCLYGGPWLHADALAELQEAAMCWSQNIKSDVKRQIWESSFPFAPLTNTDLLALNVAENPTDPPVLYLPHDDPEDISVIAPTFEQFLISWEHLCYIGPEIWLLNDFRDVDAGYLQSESTKADVLRSCFGLGAE